MIIATTDAIEGKRVVETLGLVSGGYDFEKDEALEIMSASAEKLGANAVVGLRFVVREINGIAELMPYGTAVRIK